MNYYDRELAHVLEAERARRSRWKKPKPRCAGWTWTSMGIHQCPRGGRWDHYYQSYLCIQHEEALGGPCLSEQEAQERHRVRSRLYKARHRELAGRLDRRAA